MEKLKRSSQIKKEKEKKKGEKLKESFLHQK